jgi:hypothetical protein
MLKILPSQLPDVFLLVSKQMPDVNCSCENWRNKSNNTNQLFEISLLIYIFFDPLK